MKPFYTNLIILILLAAATLFAFAACSDTDKAESFTITYIAAEGGKIDGKTTQTIDKGADGTEVSAVPLDGYVFSHWSDGETNPVRQDKNIKKDTAFIAAFIRLDGNIEFTLTYNAGEGGYLDGDEEQTVPYGHDADTVTAIHEEGYEFVKWSDGKTTAQRTDSNITVGFTVTAIFAELQEPVYVQVKYIAGHGDFINEENEILQEILYNQNTAKKSAFRRGT